MRASLASYLELLRRDLVSGQSSTLDSGATRGVGHRPACLLGAIRFAPTSPPSLREFVCCLSRLGGSPGRSTLLGLLCTSTYGYMMCESHPRGTLCGQDWLYDRTRGALPPPFCRSSHLTGSSNRRSSWAWRYVPLQPEGAIL